MFGMYLRLGFEHIADLTAYDHILFIVALTAIYQLRQWREVLILVTAFTIGHSITLALAIFDVIRFPADVVEFLIPLTIFATAVYNVRHFPARETETPQELRSDQVGKLRLNYVFALLFGLIHGMGFSNYLRAMLMPGEEGQLGSQLLAFNLGIELGQLLIVFVILVISFLALQIGKVRQRDWTIFVSGAAAGISLILMAEAKFW